VVRREVRVDVDQGNIAEGLLKRSGEGGFVHARDCRAKVQHASTAGQEDR
jgi:hypothetical protein